MDLRLCASEDVEPLEDRFVSFDRGRGLEGSGLVKVIELLRHRPYPLTVYALSSMDRLVLLSQDFWDTPWWILVSYSIDGLSLTSHIPQRKLPWPGASYSSDCEAPERMVDDILKALDACGGWDTSFAGVPGLGEIIEQELSYFEDASTAERCRGLLCAPRTTEPVVWSSEGHTSPGVALGASGDDEWLVYLCDGGYTYGRWGVATREDDRLQAILTDSWFHSLEESFHRSSAGSAGVPERLKKDSRDIEEWKRRLRREPPT